jgi:hypothetical protein
MVPQVGELGGMEIGATGLAASHDVVAGFVSTQATGAGVGVVGVDAVSNSADGKPAVREFLDPELGGQFSLFERSVVSGPVDCGVGWRRPVVAFALVELERRKAMGGGDGGSKVIGDKGGISDAYGDAFCWNRNWKQIGFGAGSFHVFGQCGFGSSDGPKRWADCGGSSHFYGWLDGEGDIGEKTAEESPPHEEWCATAWRVVTVELDRFEKWMDVLGLDCCDCLDGGPESRRDPQL